MPKKRGADHGRSTTDAAFDMDRIERAIQLARAALHASRGIDEISDFAFHLEGTVRTNIDTDTAPSTKRGIILECVGLIGIEHKGLPLVNKNNSDI